MYNHHHDQERGKIGGYTAHLQDVLGKICPEPQHEQYRADKHGRHEGLGCCRYHLTDDQQYQHGKKRRLHIHLRLPRGNLVHPKIQERNSHDGQKHVTYYFVAGLCLLFHSMISFLICVQLEYALIISRYPVIGKHFCV